MKLTLARTDLVAAMGALARIVERRNTIPILSNVLARASGNAGTGRLTLRATDLDIEAEVTLMAEVEQPGAVTLPAHLLHDIGRKIGVDRVTLDWPGDGAATLRGGRSRFTLQTLPESDFPDLAAGDLPHRFSIAGATLAGMIAKTQFAISTEETRYYLNGIYLHCVPPRDAGGDASLVAVATDGHRLAKTWRPAPNGCDGMPGVIIPRKAVAEIARMADLAAEGDIEIALSTSKIRLSAGGTVFTSKLIDGTFPDYARVIPANNDRRAVVEREALIKAADRVATISSERGRAVKLTFADGSLTLSVSNPDAGTSTDEIEVEYDAAPLDIGFNVRYLLDVLGTLSGDTALIKLADAGSPTIFQSRDDAELLIVLMPMRV